MNGMGACCLRRPEQDPGTSRSPAASSRFSVPVLVCSIALAVGEAMGDALTPQVKRRRPRSPTADPGRDRCAVAANRSAPLPRSGGRA